MKGEESFNGQHSAISLKTEGYIIMIPFDPLGWLEHIVPLRWLHRIIRFSALAIILFFIISRIGQYRYYFWKPLWAAETLLFVVVFIAFIVRTDPVNRSQGIREIIVPLLGSVLPFGLLKTYPSRWITGDLNLLTAVFAWMTLATFLTVWGMWTLRRSFSITVEARNPVASGPYRLVRHPVYLGEMLAAASVVVWRWSLTNAVILAAFIFIQLQRARWEESKLQKTFPAYREQMAGSMWFWKI
jgi:protein-S-isoprenylcysteine O-methyltransferase Ste14